MRGLAIITGGTSGIGRGIADALADRYDLALGYERDKARAAKAVKELKSRFPETVVRAYGGSLSGYASAAKFYSKIVRDFKRAPEALIHSAGRISDSLFVNAKFALQERLISEQLVAGMALAHLCLPGMYKAKAGRMIFISSISARYSLRGQTGYAAAKAGLEGFARTLALEVAHRGISVNCIAPGLIETEMTRELVGRLRMEGDATIRKRIPAGKIGQASDVASLARYLCSTDAHWITGAVIPVDGGRSLGDPES
jgi:3-oxoacyl-[acyl-carrier protein] reductase